MDVREIFSAVVVCMNFFFWIRTSLQLPVSISLTFPKDPGNWISRKGFQFTRTRILSAAYLCFLQATVVKWWVVLERVLLKLMGSWQLLQHGNNRFLYKKKNHRLTPNPTFLYIVKSLQQKREYYPPGGRQTLLYHSRLGRINHRNNKTFC